MSHARRTAAGYVRRSGDPWHDVVMAVSSARHRVLSNTVVRTVLSMWAWLVLGVVIVVWVPMVAVVRLLTAPFDKGRYAAGYLFRRLTVVHQWLNPLWRFRTSGITISDPRRPYIVVANHQSFVDILLISQLPWEMKWLSKAAFFKYPLIGWLMRMAGDIRLIRGERASIVAAMDECKDRLSKRVSVMIFPEGTRSTDGELQKFKDGAFRLAIETQSPILPLALDGTHSALVKGDWRFGVTDAEVRVLEPIETAGMTLDDVSVLRDRVRELIADELALMKAS
jgi:1-acyl-sn-glycerol-3-phosphate acyltransferase